MSIIVFVIGLVMGSFLGALSYRIPRNIKISQGRSICPKCKKNIAWYDNIPVLSYLLLQGKCRNCGKSISMRYPIIELFTAFTFVLSYLLRDEISSNITWLPANELLRVGMLLFLAFIMVAIIIIDLEHQIIPDELIFMLWGVVLVSFILNSFTPIYAYLAAGFFSALFLLIIHLLTGGKGMGLGDVKLAIVMGTILGPVLTVLWLFISFILGGFVGAFLLVLQKAKMKDRVAFGPFLIVSFFIVAVYGGKLVSLFFPYL